MDHRFRSPSWAASVELVGRLTEMGLVADVTVEADGSVPVFVLRTPVVVSLEIDIARREAWGNHVCSVVAQRAALVRRHRERAANRIAWIERVRSRMAAA